MLHGWSLLLDSEGKAANPSGSHARQLTASYLYVKARVTDLDDVISGKQQSSLQSPTKGQCFHGADHGDHNVEETVAQLLWQVNTHSQPQPDDKRVCAWSLISPPPHVSIMGRWAAVLFAERQPQTTKWFMLMKTVTAN